MIEAPAIDWPRGAPPESTSRCSWDKTSRGFLAWNCVMYPTLFKIAVFATVCAWQIGLHPRGVIASPSPKWIGSLPDAQQNLIELRLASNHRLQVVCFLGCECPLAKLYGPRLMALHDEFQSRGVTFLGINSNPQDSLADVADYVTTFNIPFPMLKDHDQVALKCPRREERLPK